MSAYYWVSFYEEDESVSDNDALEESAAGTNVNSWSDVVLEDSEEEGQIPGEDHCEESELARVQLSPLALRACSKVGGRNLVSVKSNVPTPHIGMNSPTPSPQPLQPNNRIITTGPKSKHSISHTLEPFIQLHNPRNPPRDYPRKWGGE